MKKKMNRIKIPAEIKVAGTDVSILEIDEDYIHMNNVFGQYCRRTASIVVSTSTPKSRAVDTLLHEIIHAAFDTYLMEIAIKSDDPEESIVTMMATSLTQIFRDNPQLLSYIQQELK